MSVLYVTAPPRYEPPFIVCHYSRKMFEAILHQNEDFSKFTLILPAISVGNVGQLATDLLINSLKTTKMGYINTSYIQALVGNEAFAEGADKSKGKLTTACEIYRYDDHPIVLVQINAPIVRGKSVEFRKALRDWIKEKKFQTVILLTSSFAHHRTDAQIKDPTCRFVCTPVISSLEETLVRDLSWKVLEKDDEASSLNLEKRLIPGGGIATAFIGECTEEKIPLIVLLKFCFEGNNIPDAFELVKYLDQWLKLSLHNPVDSPPITWKSPQSWKLLFGNAPPMTIY